MRRLVLLLVLAFWMPAFAQSAEPPRHKQPEILTHKPSGFWTSSRPAQGGAYRYRMMGIGAALLLGMGLVTWRLVKKANTERSTRDQQLPR